MCQTTSMYAVTGRPASTTPTPPPARTVPGMEPRLPEQDWDCLMAAVVERLRRAADDQQHVSQSDLEQVARLQAVVLECVDTLALLHKQCAASVRNRTDTPAASA